MNTDFIAGGRVGLSIGGTWRIPIKKDAPPTEGGAIELSLGYMHMFVTNLSNTGSDGIHALAGTACEGGATATNGACPNGSQAYRSSWIANLGTITNALDMINLGASYRF